MLRDQIVEKCNSEQLKQRLLAQEDLNLSKALKIARSSESAIKEARLLAGHETKDHIVSVNQFNNPNKEDKNYNENFRCYRCGGVNHKPGECRVKNMKCNNCQKV